MTAWADAPEDAADAAAAARCRDNVENITLIQSTNRFRDEQH